MENGNLNVNVSVGPEFFKADRQEDADGDVTMADGVKDEVREEPNGNDQVNGKPDEEMPPPDNLQEPPAEEASKDDDAKSSSNDSLFDDDADGEDESKVATPAGGAGAVGLALPGAKSTAATPLATPGGSASTPRTHAGPSRSAANNIPLLSPTEYKQFSSDVLLTSSMDGQVTLSDRRVGGAVGRLQPGERAPPWCMSVSCSNGRS